MRNLKKLLAVIVAICVLATFTVPAFAEETAKTDAEICEDLGVLQGTTSGVDAEYLAKGTTRIQAVIISLRLAGKEDEAYEFEGTDNFADADEVQWADGKAALAYVKANPELGWAGSTSGKFFPYEAASAQMIYKVLLEVLGYKQDVDFTWGETLEFAEEVGLVKVADVTELTNNDVAIAIVEALKANVKDGEKTLAETLVEAGAIDREAAVEAGLYSAEATVAVAQTGAKKFTVSYSRALTAEEKAAAKFTVKKGLVPYNVTAKWAEDNKSVDLEYRYSLVEGDYTVTVGEESFAVKVQAAKVAKIEIQDAYLPLMDNYELKYVVYNQFDEDMEMAVANLNVNAFNATKAAAVTVSNGKVSLVAAGAALDDQIIVTIAHSSGISATKTLSVKAAPAPKTISFGTVEPLKDKTRVTENDTGLVLPYEILDQYGDKFTLPKTTADTGGDNNQIEIGGIIFMTNKADVVDPDNFRVDDDGVLTFNAGDAGTATITATVPATGAFAVTTITVEAATGLKTFTISEPAGIVVEGEKIEIPYVATNTYGEVIEPDDFTYTLGTGANKVNIVSSNSSVIVGGTSGDFAFEDGKLYMTPTADGTATVYVYVDGALQNTVVFTVNEAPEATQFVSASFNTLFEDDATYTVTADDLKIIDQYARDWEASSISITSDATGVITASGTTLTAVEPGTAKLTITADGLTLDVTVKVIASSDIKSYKIAEIKTIYADDNATVGDPNSTAYEVPVTLEGLDANGNSVTLVSNDPEFSTSSDSEIAAVVDNNIYGVKAGKATISAWLNGKKVASAEVTVSEDAPVATTIEWADTKQINEGQNVSMLITIKDQYGVVITPTVFYAGGTVIGTNGAAGAVDADTVEEITVITSNGLSSTAKVTIKNTGI